MINLMVGGAVVLSVVLTSVVLRLISGRRATVRAWPRLARLNFYANTVGIVAAAVVVLAVHPSREAALVVSVFIPSILFVSYLGLRTRAAVERRYPRMFSLQVFGPRQKQYPRWLRFGAMLLTIVVLTAAMLRSPQTPVANGALAGIAGGVFVLTAIGIWRRRSRRAGRKHDA